MSITDIFPDIHGQADKLRKALANLGWQRKGTHWCHPEPDRQAVFLGDFIDRGPENAAVIRIVREMMDDGRARAIMGNHELNALHFHTIDPDTGSPLRPHEPDNLKQHASFLKEFPLGASHTREVLDWMKGLPLFIEDAEFRAVHAAWIDSAIDRLRAHTRDGILSEDQLIQAGRKGNGLYDLAETIAKGPELRLPDGYSFVDGGERLRHHIRVKWWNAGARTWRELAMTVPKLEQIPDDPLPEYILARTYAPEERPVFFGHYWLSGQPNLQSHNALCLDYSAGTTGPLVTYSLPHGNSELSSAYIQVHSV
jgi:hypothetical protein